MDYHIRTAAETDAPRLAELAAAFADYHHAIDPYWRPGSDIKAALPAFIREELKKPASLFLVVEMGGAIVGYLCAEVKAAEPMVSVAKIGKINSAFVAPEYRGKGLSAAAAQKAFAWMREQGATIAEVGVDSRNAPAIGAWESLGFATYRQTMKMPL